jgi:hypothetical protein
VLYTLLATAPLPKLTPIPWHSQDDKRERKVCSPSPREHLHDMAEKAGPKRNGGPPT